jgi:hypothetical protein
MYSSVIVCAEFNVNIYFGNSFRDFYEITFVSSSWGYIRSDFQIYNQQKS